MLVCSREEREVWIRAKYERKEYLADLPASSLTLGEVSLEGEGDAISSIPMVCNDVGLNVVCGLQWSYTDSNIACVHACSKAYHTSLLGLLPKYIRT